MEIALKIDAGRLLFGLSRIGYTTSASLCDIIDNSIRAEASDITLLLRKRREDFSDSRKNNVSEYVIIDNGKGMMDVRKALVLGADDTEYEANSLSKFDLG
ncbi:MAG: ATP-binding protein [Hymenobacter sp.]